MTLTFEQLIKVLIGHRKTVVKTFLWVVGLTILLCLFGPRRYTANTDVVVDVKSPDPVAGMLLPAMMANGYMATQLDILTSRRDALSVIDQLKLDTNPRMVDAWGGGSGPEDNIREWLVKYLKKHVNASAAQSSNVISLTYRDKDPEFAANVANAFAQAYINTTLELRIEPAASNAKWFKQQSKGLREDLENAQEALTKFQQEHGIVSGAEANRIDYETAKLNELSTQLTLVETQNADSASKGAPGDSASVLPEVISNPLIQQLKVSIAQNEALLEDMSSRLGVNHPQYKSLKAHTDALRQELATQTARITSSISMTNKVGMVKGDALEQQIADQKKVVLALNANLDEMRVLQQDVDTAQKAYDAVSQRFTQTSLESQAGLTNVSVLSPAVPPIEPSFPKPILMIPLSVIMGLFLGTGLALMKEMQEPRIRTESDVQTSLNLPILAYLKAPAQPKLGWQQRFFALMGRRPLIPRAR